MLSREWLQAFVPVGTMADRNQWQATGSGVVFLEHEILWLVTALHVVTDTGKARFIPLLTKSDGVVVIVQLADVQRASGFSWLEDASTDVAITPLPVMPGLAIKAVTRRECILINDVVPSMPSYTLGCPYGMAGVDPSHPAPLVLDGVVSGMKQPEGLIYTSTPTFPGNSGGPLVVYRNPFSAAGGLQVSADKPVVLFAGLVLEYRLVTHSEHSKMPPLHLGVVRSADAVLKLLGSIEAAEMAAKLLGRR